MINVAKSDLHPFRMDGSGDDTTRNMVWEYIAAGAGAKWRKVMDH